MALAHQNLAVAVGAAKEHARMVLRQFEDRGDPRTGRSQRLLKADPPPVEHFVLGVARGTPGQA